MIQLLSESTVSISHRDFDPPVGPKEMRIPTVEVRLLVVTGTLKITEDTYG
jgi:hypothetical protein